MRIAVTTGICLLLGLTCCSGPNGSAEPPSPVTPNDVPEMSANEALLREGLYSVHNGGTVEAPEIVILRSYVAPFLASYITVTEGVYGATDSYYSVEDVWFPLYGRVLSSAGWDEGLNMMSFASDGTATVNVISNRQGAGDSEIARWGLLLLAQDLSGEPVANYLFDERGETLKGYLSNSAALFPQGSAVYFPEFIAQHDLVSGGSAINEIYFVNNEDDLLSGMFCQVNANRDPGVVFGLQPIEGTRSNGTIALYDVSGVATLAEAFTTLGPRLTDGSWAKQSYNEHVGYALTFPPEAQWVDTRSCFSSTTYTDGVQQIIVEPIPIVGCQCTSKYVWACAVSAGTRLRSLRPYVNKTAALAIRNAFGIQ